MPDQHAPVPPQNLDAEEAVLGALMLGPNAIDTVQTPLQPGDFYRAQHGTIYKAALALHAAGEPVDAVTLADYLDEQRNGTGSLLEHVGGRQRIHELASIVPSPSTAAHYATIVREMAVLRRLIRVGGEISRLGWDRPGDLTDLLGQARDLVDSLDKETVASEPFGHALSDFLQLDLQAQPALLGTDNETLLPAGGLALLSGLPGAGKTTLIVDLVFHLATGTPWLDIPIENPVSVLLIENEGPQHKFQAKLRAKHAAWDGTIKREIHVQTLRWGAFSFAQTQDHHAFRKYLDDNHIDVVIGDPLDTLGTEGVGSPEDTRNFVKLLPPLGLTTTRAFLFLHHPRKELSANEINQLSGAWGGRLDTLMVLKTTDQPDELRLSFPKLRWADARQPLILGKLRDTASFEVLRHEVHEPDPEDTQVEAMLQTAISVLRKKGGALERQVLALHCETAATNRAFQMALAAGYQRDLLAKERHGRKVHYSLAPDAYL